MKGRYDSVIDEGDKTRSDSKKLNCAWMMLKTIGTNHLPTIEGKIDRNNKKIMFGLLVILLATLFQDQLSLSSIFAFIWGLF
ncbi:MAG: hypothetical protein GTN43_00705 [Candidatus Aenigmarchaeota archaeon]|nr:hypothetical protein [Candidatus Aenigmarchaeota archaeon]